MTRMLIIPGHQEASRSGLSEPAADAEVAKPPELLVQQILSGLEAGRKHLLGAGGQARHSRGRGEEEGPLSKQRKSDERSWGHV